MSVINPLQGCTVKINYHAQIGVNKEAWNWKIGSKSKAFRAATRTQKRKVIEEVATHSLKYIAGGAKRSAQIVIESISDEPFTVLEENKKVTKYKEVIHYKLYYDGKVEDHHTAEDLFSMAEME